MSTLLKHNMDLIESALLKATLYIDYIKEQNIELHNEANGATFDENGLQYSIEEEIHQALKIIIGTPN